MRYLHALLTIASIQFFFCPAASQEVRRFPLFSSINARSFVDALSNRAPGSAINFDVDAASRMERPEPADSQTIVDVLVPGNANTRRRNLLIFDRSSLNSAVADYDTGQGGSVVSLDVFPDKHLDVQIVNKKTEKDGSVSIIGNIANSNGGTFVVNIMGNQTRGTIRNGADYFEFYPAPADVIAPLAADVITDPANTVVVDDIISNFPNEADPTSPKDVKKRSGMVEDFDLEIDDTTITPARIDVLVTFTNEASTAFGGDQSAVQAIRNAINETNLSLSNSSIQHTMNEVGIEKIDYIDSGDVQLDRDRVQGKEDGFMDKVHETRNSIKADVVALIVAKGLPYCGIAYIPEDVTLDYSEYAFMVVNAGCMTKNLSFAHEFGHLLGARHDRYVDATELAPFKTNHGVIFKCGDTYCRDIMAYSNYCSSVLNVSACPRNAVWSGPNWSDTAEIVPLEDKFSSNRRVMRVMGGVVSKYR
ncbi:M12 family metallo-peptidase [Sinorhizobium meliloti]|uniref:M12 family metallo-peptidase n=1 Tax=Rhizobium meliloti TaxID=382 RepID=UPI001AED0EBE|nr:M12 family metallo-peptidase [Sinorhizobium meliloti]